MQMIANIKNMPGPRAPAFSLGLALAVGLLGGLTGATPALAQQGAPQPSIQPPPSIRPTPSQLELSKMIWSTVAAVDHANRSGNYSVLRDIASQGFQINNNAAQLSEIFASLRRSQIDLSNAFLVPPTYTEAPRLISEDVFEVKGVFQLRPVSISFDIYFQWEAGQWKLYGIDLQPLQMVERVPGR